MEINGADIDGINGKLIKFDITLDKDRSGVRLLGMVSKVVKESYDRATRAIGTLQGDWGLLDGQGYTIQMEPAESEKFSSGLALPIAIMLLQANVLQGPDHINRQIEKIEEKLKKLRETDGKKALLLENKQKAVRQKENFLAYRKRLSNNKSKYILIGNLNIVDGQLLTPEHGMLGMISAAEPGSTLIIPEDSELHGAFVANAFKEKNRDITVFVAKDLQEVWNVIVGVKPGRKAVFSDTRIEIKEVTGGYVPDLKVIEGVVRGKRAMVVALAGGHNILLVGPPGTGKSMLSQAASGLLPKLTHAELFEVNKIYSAAGELRGNELVTKKPFQQAYSTITEAALFGGGTASNLRPGIASKAHEGILLIDEINLFKPELIEKLRNALNLPRSWTIQRVKGGVSYPCNFMMVASLNPCKCGWLNHLFCSKCQKIFVKPQRHCSMHTNTELKSKCGCSPNEIHRFRDRLSGPLLERIDLKIWVSEYDVVDAKKYDYASSTTMKKIKDAREIQEKRYRSASWGKTNSTVPDRSQLELFAPRLMPNVSDLIDRKKSEFNLSQRVVVKLLLVARTIADLDFDQNSMAANHIRIKDVEEAIDLMGLNNSIF